MSGPGEGAGGAPPPAAAPPRRLAAAITAGALVVAVAHLVWPDLRIDAVTLALLVVAIVPWLGPIFRTIELPGGWRFEYQAIQRQVEEVERRVEGMERLLFSGDTTPALEERLTAAVRGFAGYLAEVHQALSVNPPSVRLQRGLENAQYDGQADEIELDPDFAEDDYAVLREYAHHVLLTTGPPWDRLPLGLESGVADFLVASHTGRPGLGAALAHRLREPLGDVSKPYIRDLLNDLRIDAPREPHDVHAEGEAWGGALWDLRQALGRPTADRAVAAAWVEGGWSDGRGFARAVAERLDGDAAGTARDIFARRGVPISA